jgi:Ricin-type beta-trefoil lectin domain/Putative Ig domain
VKEAPVQLRLLFASCAALSAVAAAGPAIAAPATAPAPASVTSRPPLHQVNLRAAFGRALRTARTGAIGGVVPPVGGRPRAATTSQASAACTEPDCDLPYGGGPVQHSPKVYLVLWGPNWTASSPAYLYLASFYSGLGVAPDDTWSTVTSQYGDGSGTPAFGTSVYAGAVQDTSTPPLTVTPDDLAAEAAAAAGSIGISDIADAQVVIASETGTCFSDGFAGSCGAPTSNTTAYCAWHSMTNGGLPFTNLPYQLDAQSECGEDFINVSTGTYDGFSIVGGHEYAETITDPDASTGWIDLADNVSGGEIADKCVWGGSVFGLNDPDGDVTLSTGSFAMQSLWSNADGGCVMKPAGTLTVTNPGTQTSTLGVPVSLAIDATSTSNTALTFSASKLPAGLVIDTTTGRITGKPATTAGTWHTTVTVSAGTPSSQVSFTWRVSSKAGAVKGYASKCLDDNAGRTARGTKIDLWSCDGQARQRVTFRSDGELRVSGKCVSDKNGATVLESCTGAAAQTWTRRSNGEYVVSSAGACLAVPASSTANGTQLRLSACTDSRRERWSLP